MNSTRCLDIAESSLHTDEKMQRVLACLTSWYQSAKDVADEYNRRYPRGFISQLIGLEEHDYTMLSILKTLAREGFAERKLQSFTNKTSREPILVFRRTEHGDIAATRLKRK